MVYYDSMRLNKGGTTILITRESDYALRIVRNLNENEVRSIAPIVDKEGITTAIAYKVARKLEKGGLIRSIRGNAGGYQLVRGLDKISILDVYKIMEPDAAINHCLRKGTTCPLNTCNSPCNIHYELNRIQARLMEELGRRSIQEIMTEDKIDGDCCSR